MRGGPGNDDYFGGDGQDALLDLVGADELNGGDQDDRLDARDGGFDIVNGGFGTDTCRFDAGVDVVESCEIQNP